ncbi:MAG: hypothetical protein QM500_17480 [Methylococcales bacterium]
MLCKVASWSNCILSSGNERDEKVFEDKPPFARISARKFAIDRSRNDINRNYGLCTWNDKTQEWNNYEVFSSGNQLDC